MASHYLVVGGTGMLSGVVKQLLTDGHTVSVISRTDESFRALIEVSETTSLYHISCDYHDINSLKIKLKHHTDSLGVFDFSVCWVHEPSEIKVCSAVAEFTKHSLWHVVGSAVANPSKPDEISNRLFFFNQHYPDIDYRIIILGFIIKNCSKSNNSRWLYNSEISTGINVALKNGLTVNVIGITAPWSLRPGF